MVTLLNTWEWGRRGVDLHQDHLLWFEREGDVRFASGGAVEQGFDDFLVRGPWVDGVPEDVVNEVTQAVRALVDAADR